jgi:hypothetical protein
LRLPWWARHRAAWWAGLKAWPQASARTRSQAYPLHSIHYHTRKVSFPPKLTRTFRMRHAAGVVGAVVLPVTGVGVGVVQMCRGVANTPEAIREQGHGKIWDKARGEWVAPDMLATVEPPGAKQGGGPGGFSRPKPGEDYYEILQVPHLHAAVPSRAAVRGLANACGSARLRSHGSLGAVRSGWAARGEELQPRFSACTRHPPRPLRRCPATPRQTRSRRVTTCWRAVGTLVRGCGCGAVGAGLCGCGAHSLAR